jgi:hypothetical protein
VLSALTSLRTGDRRALRTFGYYGVLAMSDVREELVSEPKFPDLLGDLHAFALDEGDPVPPVAGSEFLDFGER